MPIVRQCPQCLGHGCLYIYRFAGPHEQMAQEEYECDRCLGTGFVAVKPEAA